MCVYRTWDSKGRRGDKRCGRAVRACCRLVRACVRTRVSLQRDTLDRGACIGVVIKNASTMTGLACCCCCGGWTIFFSVNHQHNTTSKRVLLLYCMRTISTGPSYFSLSAESIVAHIVHTRNVFLRGDGRTWVNGVGVCRGFSWRNGCFRV